MKAAAYIFWISLFLVFYTYLFYPVILFCAYTAVQLKRDIDYLTGRRNRRARGQSDDDLPPVTMIVPVYNEEEHLEEKIANVRQTDYPADKLQVIFVSDGSTDRSDSILETLKEPNVRVIYKARGGKPTALNVGVEQAINPILIMSDGSTLFEPDAIRMLVRHFDQPEVGAVCGSLKFAANAESQQTEGFYWKYESMLRLMESRLGATLTASGAIYALRREAWIPLSPDTVLDDFVTPINARNQGFDVLYDPEAIALDFAPSSVKGEFARRVRIAMGSFRGLGTFLTARLSTFTRFAFLSHKLMRWTVPQFLLLVIFSNLFLLGTRFYLVIFGLQAAFYFWAALGYLFQKQLKKIRFALVGYFLLAMNLAFLVGLFRFLTTKKGATWQRVS
jgi:cellulose synthase/poly-beta-1,6-N-acetylglucosamine synthase-like glycosyltransferase